MIAGDALDEVCGGTDAALDVAVEAEVSGGLAWCEPWHAESAAVSAAKAAIRAHRLVTCILQF